MGPSGTLFDYSQPESQRWPFYFLQQWAVRIGGGTEQVQSNILGERVLGLPREPDVSRDLPWKELGKTSSGKAAT